MLGLSCFMQVIFWTKAPLLFILAIKGCTCERQKTLKNSHLGTVEQKNEDQH